MLGATTAVATGAFLLEAVGDFPRICANLLVVSYGLLGFGLGGGVLLALLFVTGARWSDRIRPVAEKLTLLLPVGAAGVVFVLLACPSLYLWTGASAEPASPFQAFWLSRPFFLARAAIYMALWLGLSLLLVRASRRLSLRPASSDRKCVRIGALFLVVFSLTCWLASVDWIMSLEPRWSSTIFGVYNFAGMFLGAVAAIVILALWFNRYADAGSRIAPDLLRDLGTLLFAFSSFWMYIWFCQYLLIWYVNNPEETDYYVLRQREFWQPLLIANLVLNWAVPFVVLLFRRAKESPSVLLLVAVIVLAGRWVDLYLMVLPPVAARGTAFGGWDACLVAGTMGLAALILASRAPSGSGSPRTAIGETP
jgi:hypothetical protein